MEFYIRLGEKDQPRAIEFTRNYGIIAEDELPNSDILAKDFVAFLMMSGYSLQDIFASIGFSLVDHTKYYLYETILRIEDLSDRSQEEIFADYAAFRAERNTEESRVFTEED